MLSVATNMFLVTEPQNSEVNGVFVARILPAAEMDTPNWLGVWNFFIESYLDMMNLIGNTEVSETSTIKIEEIESEFGLDAKVLVFTNADLAALQAAVKEFCEFVIGNDVSHRLAQLATILDRLFAQ